MIAPPVIKIRSLRVYAYHGVYRSERDYGQQFIIDADIQLKHFPEDKIDSTLDYDSLTGKFVQYATASSVNLIETLADHLAKIAVLDPMVEWVSLSITKPNPPLAYMKQVTQPPVMLCINLIPEVIMLKNTQILQAFNYRARLGKCVPKV